LVGHSTVATLMKSANNILIILKFELIDKNLIQASQMISCVGNGIFNINFTLIQAGFVFGFSLYTLHRFTGKSSAL
jgi:hypothetical protein